MSKIATCPDCGREFPVSTGKTDDVVEWSAAYFTEHGLSVPNAKVVMAYMAEHQDANVYTVATQVRNGRAEALRRKASK